MTRAELLAEIRQNLKEAAASIWTDAELYTYMTQVAREIAEREPMKKRANLTLVDYTFDVDISGLTDLYRLFRVEHPIGNNSSEPIWRPHDIFSGTIVRLDLEDVPTITSGVLAGTVTFTKDSRAVAGSGTAFTTALSTHGLNGYLICKSTGTKYYQVAEVTSDTALTLFEPFDETTGADTVNVTKYRSYDSCARIYYGGTYTIDGTTCNLPAKLSNAEILGVVAKAATEYASNYLQVKLTAVTTLLTSSSALTGTMATRITQALDDIGKDRTNLATNLTGYVNTLADIETALDSVTTYVSAAATNVNTVQPGGNLASKYTEMGKAAVQEAQQRMEKAKSYLESAKTSHDSLDIATQELAAAASIASEAESFMKQAEQSINVVNIVNSYKAWAQGKYQEYERELAKLGRVDDGIIRRGVRG